MNQLYPIILIMIDTVSSLSPVFRRSKKLCTKKKIDKTLEGSHEQSKQKQFFRTSTRSQYYSHKGEPKSAIVCSYSKKQDKYQVIYKKSINDKRQIASLTKIMTILIALEQIQLNGIIPEQQIYTVSKMAAVIGGTSACLEVGDEISLWDLLHGLMLPSGNDAAICIAQNIGEKYLKPKKIVDIIDKPTNFRINSVYKKTHQNKKNISHNNLKTQGLSNFIERMNIKAKQLGMSNTNYSNPHGLSDQHNFSTVEDQMKLIHICLKHQLFRRIVKTKLYFGSVEEAESGWTRQILWQNTNRLLYNGYQGIKTGNTIQAKYCLASWYFSKQTDTNLVVIVLGCQNKESRDSQSINLTKMGMNIINSRKQHVVEK